MDYLNNFALEYIDTKKDKPLGICLLDSTTNTKNNNFFKKFINYFIVWLKIQLIFNLKILIIMLKNIYFLKLNSSMNILDFNLTKINKLELFCEGYNKMEEIFIKN